MQAGQPGRPRWAPVARINSPPTLKGSPLVNSAFRISSSASLRFQFRFSSRSARKRVVLTFATVLLAVFLFSISASADTVVLKNGDRLTGSVTQIAGGKLTIHTDYAGDVAIAFDQVSSVKVEKPIVLSQETKKGKKVDIHKTEITAIDRTDSGYTVTTASGTESFPAAGLSTVRTPGAQQAYEASLHPGWLHDWTATANVSFALARGNSNATTLGTGFTAQRPTLTDKTSVYFNDIYANTTATTNGVSAASTTADNIGAGFRYDHNVNPSFSPSAPPTSSKISSSSSIFAQSLAAASAGTPINRPSSSSMSSAASSGPTKATAPSLQTTPLPRSLLPFYRRPTALPHSILASNILARLEPQACLRNRLISSPTWPIPASTALPPTALSRPRSSPSLVGRPPPAMSM
jgi:hypothetical protein